MPSRAAAIGATAGVPPRAPALELPARTSRDPVGAAVARMQRMAWPSVPRPDSSVSLLLHLILSAIVDGHKSRPGASAIHAPDAQLDQFSGRRSAGRRRCRSIRPRGRRPKPLTGSRTCARTRSGTPMPPSATTPRAPACSPRRCWGRPSTGWPSSPATAGRSSSPSAPAASPSRWPSAACPSPASSCPVR